MTDPKAELKPCPFCGGKPTLMHHSLACVGVECEKCNLRFMSMEVDESEAITTWNTRTPTTGFNAGLEAAANALRMKGFTVAADIVSSLKTAPGADGWRTDWENAPRDGTTILVWSERGPFSVEWNGPCLGMASNEAAYVDGWYVDDGKRNLCGLRGPEPTHFMLITPPTSSREVTNE